jgi:hypothetical protein
LGQKGVRSALDKKTLHALRSDFAPQTGRSLYEHDFYGLLKGTNSLSQGVRCSQARDATTDDRNALFSSSANAGHG